MNKVTEDIFDDLSEALEDAFYSVVNEIKTASTVNKSQTTSTVHRKNQTAKQFSKNKVLPTIPHNISDLEYKTRYSNFINNIQNIDYSYYPNELIDGFKAAISQYQKLLDANQHNFKKADMQLFNDLKECKKRCDSNLNDNYLSGYYDGLTMIRKLFNQSKLSSYKLFADKFN